MFDKPISKCEKVTLFPLSLVVLLLCFILVGRLVEDYYDHRLKHKKSSPSNKTLFPPLAYTIEYSDYCHSNRARFTYYHTTIAYASADDDGPCFQQTPKVQGLYVFTYEMCVSPDVREQSTVTTKTPNFPIMPA